MRSTKDTQDTFFSFSQTRTPVVPRSCLVTFSFYDTQFQLDCCLVADSSDDKATGQDVTLPLFSFLSGEKF